VVVAAGMAARARGHRSRVRDAWRLVALVVLVAALGWVALASLLRPLTVTCDPALTRGVCEESVTAALARGLGRPHGLLLEASVEPGPAATPGALGHRATVTFVILGAPAVRVALYLDMGGHWGGVVDRDALEVAAAPVIQAGAVGALGLIVAWSMRSSATRRRDRPRSTQEETGGQS
jgi:hypothetical protein